MNRLEKWINDNKMNFSSFGRKIGASRDKIRKYHKLSVIPRKETMILIQQATNNEVQPIDFYKEESK